MATGFLVCWWIIERLSGRKDLSNLLVSLMLCGVVGSRAAYVIEHWQSEFARNPAAIIRVDQGGLMFYGGFILAFIAFFVWCAAKREHPLALADLLAAVVPLVGIGAVGQGRQQIVPVVETISDLVFQILHTYSFFSFMYSILAVMSSTMPDSTKATACRMPAQIASW